MKPVLLLLVVMTVCQSRHRANNWGSLDGAGEYTIQSRTRDQLDQYAGANLPFPSACLILSALTLSLSLCLLYLSVSVPYIECLSSSASSSVSQHPRDERQSLSVGSLSVS